MSFPVLANLSSCYQNFEVCWSSPPLVSVSVAAGFPAKMIAELLAQLRSANLSLEISQFQVEEAHRASLRILSAMCDVVVELDKDLRFHKPSHHASNFF